MSIKNIYIFIDGGYFCFYRLYTTMAWWKKAKIELVKNGEQEIASDPEFIDKWRQGFVKSLQEIPKKLGLSKQTTHKIFVGKDCKRVTNWRMGLLNEYKANRKENTIIGSFFTKVFEEELFQQGGVEVILDHPHLEADDVIALSVKKLLQENPDNIKIYIITSDKDYLQLLTDETQIEIYNLAFKNIATLKSSFGSFQANLFCKIVMGDTSDNIRGVLKKCGPKTALKCFNDRDYFLKRILEENAQEKYELNQKLIDFNCIPQKYIDEFYSSISL
jgi:5'-3' exonuclease